MNELPLRCIVVDDERLATEKLAGFISKIHYLDLKGAFDNGIDALLYLKKHPVDLLFLDIQMDDLDGLQLLELLNPKPYVILTTAYHEFALRGYELEVSDYLLKPIGFDRFLQSAERVYKRTATATRQLESNRPSDGAPEYFFVRSNYQLVKVFHKELLYLEAKKERVIIHCQNKTLQTIKTLQDFEDKLPRPPFFRIHKSYLISFYHVNSISSQQIQIVDQRLPMGDFYKKSILDYLKKI